jgi:tetratricopeptide (TPR) repeat protein
MHFLKRLDVAEERFNAAISVNPNDSLAWLLKGTLHAFRGEGKDAVRSTSRALRLSPLDPLKYYYDSLSATAALAAGEPLRAIEFAERSIRANRRHTSTLRALAIGRWQAGDAVGARSAIEQLRTSEPDLTVSAWRARTPSRGYAICDDWAKALQAAGLPP